MLQKRIERLHSHILKTMPFLLFAFFFCIPFAKQVAGPAYSLYFQLFIVHLILRPARGAYEEEARTYYILILIYFLITALSLTYSSDIIDGLARFKKQIGLTMIMILIETVSTRERARQYLYAFSAGGAVLAVITIYQSLVLHLDRPPTLWNPIHGGNLLLFAGVTSLALLISEPSIRAKLLSGALFLIHSLAIYLNGTRGVWVAFVIVLIAAPLVMSRLALLRRLSYASIIIMLGSALFFTPYAREKLDATIHDFKIYPRESYTSSGVRYEMWKSSVKMFSESPFFGVGIGDWKKEIAGMVERKEAPGYLVNYNQTHNIFFDALGTRGIIGLAAFLAVLIYPMVYAWRGREKEDELFRNIVLFTGVAFMISGLTDTLTYIRWSFLSYIALTGVGLSVLMRHTGKMPPILNSQFIGGTQNG